MLGGIRARRSSIPAAKRENAGPMGKKATARSVSEETPNSEATGEGGEESTGVRKVWADHALPEGYEDRSADLVGTWSDELSPTIHFIPLELKLFDSNQDTEKASVLIIAELVDAIPLINRDKEETVGEPGDMIGVWAKPGMKAVLQLGGCKVFMYENGEIDTGKKNPMKTFRVASKERKGKRLEVTEDYRKDSKGRKCWAIPSQSAVEKGAKRGPATDDGDDETDKELF